MKDTPSQSDSLKFWQNVMAYFCSNDFSVWQARASLKLSIDNILCIELKQSYFEILESVSAVLAKISWYFHQSLQGLAAAVPLLEIDNISLVCRYIIEICPVLMACTWKNRVLLAAFWDKISIFHLGQTEHLPTCAEASTCGQVRARAWVQVLQNSGSQMVVLRFTTLSAQSCQWWCQHRDHHWRNPRTKTL